MEEFKKLGLSDKTIDILRKKGYTKPTTIQAKAIPLLLEGKMDVIGKSQTGTGKTASFALPILMNIRGNTKTVQAIILTPTRELAIQVALEIESLKVDKHIQILSVYGGAPIGPQRQKLREGVEIVVGTPGRVMDLQRRKSLNLDHIQYAVLDEADEMLNMGFVEDIETILQNTPKEKSMLLFSATMPAPILNIAKKYMREYELIEIEKSQIIIDTVEQIYYDINAKDRIEGIRRIIDFYTDFYGIIFCNTKATVDNVAQKLKTMEYAAEALHGDITQNQREKILNQFRNRTIKILVATDVAARGIDVIDLTHVINFCLPQSPESYVHRIGRTGRAGKKGIAITFVIPSERRQLSFIERINKCKLTKQKLPSAEQIIENNESKIKILIKNIIDTNKGKSLKFESLADDLLNEYQPKEILLALIKYGFKKDLDIKSFKKIEEPVPSRGTSSSGRSNFSRDTNRSSSRSDRRYRTRIGQKTYKRSDRKSTAGHRKPYGERPRQEYNRKPSNKPVRGVIQSTEKKSFEEKFKKKSKKKIYIKKEHDSKPNKREKMFNKPVFRHHKKGKKKIR